MNIDEQREFDALTLDQHLENISALTYDLGHRRCGPILGPQMVARAALHMAAVRQLIGVPTAHLNSSISNPHSNTSPVVAQMTT
jgi:hypothetical protein